uniref:KIB1-4 beta-propeller domain-containing protein n=1 Tax=Arundo donax TaxID=35708 RepID=A0A0A8Z392_ARUDO
MAAVQGKFYFRKSPGVVGVLSFAHDPEPHMEMATFDAPMPTFVGDAPQKVTMTYLLESSQQLFLVCLFFLGCSFEHIEEVGAYRMDFSKQEWCKVTDIGDRAFLLGDQSFAASCSALEHGLKTGCVYFVYDFFGDSNDFHIFDLLDGTRELAGPTQDIPLLARQPFWMVPVR